MQLAPLKADNTAARLFEEVRPASALQAIIGAGEGQRLADWRFGATAIAP